MAWIKFEKDLLTDPRVLRIAKTLQARWKLYETLGGSAEFELGNDEALPAVTLVCGALVRIWCLADRHVGNDDVLPLGKTELDEVVGIPGFCDLMPKDWLESIDDQSVKLPDFHAHNGTAAKKKAVTQKRVAAFRSRHAGELPDRNASALPDQTKTRPRPDTTTFDVFWSSYPRKTAKQDAFKAFEKLHLVNGDFEKVLAALEAAKASEQWGRDDGKFIPHASTWLNGRRFEDEGHKPASIKVDV